jgi:hypothetical protein
MKTDYSFRFAMLVIILLWAMVMILSATTAQAQSAPCYDRAPLILALQDRWGETVQARGLSANGRMVELWANVDTGSWTITSTGPDGPICLEASGEGFELALDPTSPEGEES